MILQGRFGDTSGRPYLEGRLHIPRLRLVTDISFLVDTGADSTTLLPDDAKKMGLDFSALTINSHPSKGVGGFSEGYVEQALLVFNDPGRSICWYNLDLDILKPDEHLREMPSLLGRDVLNRMKMCYSPPTNSLSFQATGADRIFSFLP